MATATPTDLTAHLADVITKLRQEFAQLDPGAVTSPNALTAIEARRSTIRNLESGILNNGLDKPLKLLGECEKSREIVLEKQASLEKEIADAPDWRSFSDGRQRDREYDRQQHLKRQLERLNEGTLLIAPGVTAESLSAIDERIVALHRRIAEARDRFDATLQQAEALLGITPRETVSD